MTATVTPGTCLFRALVGMLSASAQTKPRETFSKWLRASRSPVRVHRMLSA
jgi:hypothetical protein